MRVLWIVNRILPLFYNDIGIKETNFGGGWLTGLSETLRRTDYIKLAVCTPLNDIEDIRHGDVKGVRYYLYHDYGWNRYCEENKVMLKRVIDEFCPDVIHVFGTEYPRVLEVLDVAGSERVLISLTGILSEYYPVYDAGVPSKYTRSHNVIRAVASRHRRLFFLQNRLIAYGKSDFEMRAQYEVAAIKKARYVTGRTDFDHAFAKRINHGIQYFFCNESLRKVFYEEPVWQYDHCEKHTLFVSNAGYPIKGFHMLLQAAPRLLKKYPDLKIRVAGNAPFAPAKGLKNRIIRATDEYGKYLQRLIHSNHLEDVVQFLGNLNDQQMKREFIRANVFVLPSAIENSPNSLGEAMMLRTPCVASNVGGVTSMLKDREEGIIYNFDDVNALIAAVSKLFDNPEMAIRYGQKAAMHAVKTHCLDENNKTMIQIYQEIINANRKE